MRIQRGLDEKSGSTSHQLDRHIPSLHLSILTYEMGITIVPASQKFERFSDIISAWPLAQNLVYSNWWLLKDRKELEIWLLATALISQPQRGGRCQGDRPQGGKEVVEL